MRLTVGLFSPVYTKGGPPIDDADRSSTLMPYTPANLLHRWSVKRRSAVDKASLCLATTRLERLRGYPDRLEGRGLKLTDGLEAVASRRSCTSVVVDATSVGSTYHGFDRLN